MHWKLKHSCTDRQNFTHFLDMKFNGSDYVSSDGFLINLFENISGDDGDCVVIKNGSLHTASCDLPAYFVCENKYGYVDRAIAVTNLFDCIKPFY
jgi:hypothetical protein